MRQTSDEKKCVPIDKKTTEVAVRLLRFGDVELDLSERCVRRKEGTFYLADHYWKALMLLVKRAGTVATKEALRAELGHCADGTLTKVIERIRGALGDSALPRRFIKTEAQRGYRWLPTGGVLPSTMRLEKHKTDVMAIAGYIWPVRGTGFDPAWTAANAEKDSVSMPPEPQETLWGENVGMGPGIYIASSGEFVPWGTELIEEIKTKLLNQCGRHLPPDCGLALGDYRGRDDWLTLITGPNGAKRGEIWFGTDPDNDWKYDGLVRVGDDTYVVWQVFQRYSDGSYRRIRMQPPRSTVGSAA